jgi:hypothetical protein
VRDRADHSTHNESSMLWKSLAADRAHLLAAAEPDQVAEYVKYQRAATGFPLATETVETTIEEVIESDALADVTAALDHEGYDVIRQGPRLMMVLGDFANPIQIALHAVGMAEDLDLVGAWAVNTDGRWAFVAWSRPDLVTISPARGKTRARWRHQVLGEQLGPNALYSQRFTAEGLPHEKKHQPWGQPFPEARRILDRLGIEDPTPGPAFHCG